MTAIELGLGEELVIGHASGLGDLCKRNEITGSGIRIGIAEYLALGIVYRLDA